MSDTAFYEKYRAHREHMAQVPHAMKAARDLLADAATDESTHAVSMDVDKLRTLVAEVDRLQAALKQAHKDAAEEQREFQREARDIAAEARWTEQHRDEWGSY